MHSRMFVNIFAGFLLLLCLLALILFGGPAGGNAIETGDDTARTQPDEVLPDNTSSLGGMDSTTLLYEGPPAG
jgi:hypothetical protein